MDDVKKFFKNKKVLITGHTGFKGSWLTQILLDWGVDVAGISLRPPTSPNLFTLLNIKSKIKNYFVDIRDFKKVKKIFLKEKPEIVFHLAAQTLVRNSYDAPLFTFETNIIGTANVLHAIKETGSVKAAVMITTDKVYEEKGGLYPYKEGDKLAGHDPYSASKAGAEILIDSYTKSFFNLKHHGEKHKTLIASARSGNVIGGGDWAKDRIIPDITKAVFENNGRLIMRSPDAVRPWQFVLEPLYGYILLAKKLYEGKKEFSGAWNFGPHEGNYLTVKELTEEVIRILGKGSYAIEKDDTKHEAAYLKLDISKAKDILGWQPVFNLNKTLEFTLAWYKIFYDKKDITDITHQQIESFFKEI